MPPRQSFRRIKEKSGADGGIRTPDPQIRSLMLYPLSYVRCLRKSLPFSLGSIPYHSVYVMPYHVLT
jgi:hypothetical protein